MRARVVAVAAVVVLLFGSIAVAQPKVQGISQIVVLGDSLSDNGNFYRATGAPPFPYWEGRISNGPVAVEYLADNLGALPLWDFAWSGATTGVGNYNDGGTVDALGAYHLPGIITAFHGALAAKQFPIDPNALYVVWAGPNDFWTVSTQQEIMTALQKAIMNLVIVVRELQALGAKRILVCNMPDLGTTPLFLGSPWAGTFSSISQAFNTGLRLSLPPGVRYFDTFSFMSGVLANPAAYGFTNATAPCFTGTAVCANPNAYFFWDEVHPTTAAHAVLAEAFKESLGDSVVIGGCDSGVPDFLTGGGFTISELIAQAAVGARNHGQFVSAVASITNGLVSNRVITGNQKGAIQSCAAR